MDRPPRPSARSEALALARDLWRRSRAVVRRTPGLLGVSFLLGGALWIVVTDTENPSRLDDFPSPIRVTAVNVGPQLAVANTLPSVELRVSAAQSRWEKLTAANFEAFVDLNGLGAREQQVPVEVTVHDTRGVRVVGITPPTILVNLESFETASVPVTTRLLGTVPLGYEVASLRPAVDSVQVEGPQSLVALVHEVAAELNVTGLTVGLEQTVSLVPLGEGGGEIRGVRLDPATVRVAVEIRRDTLERVLPLRPVITGEVADGYRVTGVRVSPAVARLQGAIDVLQGIDEIELSPLSISGATADRRRIFSLTPPPGTALLDQESVAVTVTVEPIPSSLRLTLPVDVVGQPEGLTATLTPVTVTVTLDGPMPALARLGSGDVAASVDLSALAAGTVTVEVQVAAPSGLKVTAVQPPSVSVTLVVP